MSLNVIQSQKKMTNAGILKFRKSKFARKEAVNMKNIHDVIIIGGGPGGYSAALYAARAGLDTVVLEKLSAGGQMAQTAQIDNFPGFNDGIDGFELGVRMQRGAERFGAVTVFGEAQSVELEGKIKTVHTSEGDIFSKSVIIATGADHRHLGIEGESSLAGNGVHYCASCDGMFYNKKTVVVVGGGNSAVSDALTLSRIAKKVIVVHRRDTFRAEKAYQAPLAKAENVEIFWNSTVEELLRKDSLTGVRIKDVNTGALSDIMCDGVFVSIGRTPNTSLFNGKLRLDENGYIISDESTRTDIPGVFAAGDVRTKAFRQIVTAAADGAVAAHYAGEYLAEGSLI